MSDKDFKKIRSVLTRKEVWKSSYENQATCFIKFFDDTKMAQLYKLEDDYLIFKIAEAAFTKQEQSTLKQRVLDKDIEILGFLNNNQERYFFSGIAKGHDLAFIQEDLLLKLSYRADLFLLDRRGHLRVKIPSSYGLVAHLTKIQNKNIHIQALIVDISANGLKLFIQKRELLLDLEIGFKFFLQIQAGPHKTIAVEAKVRHLSESADHYTAVGLMIDESQIKSSYRLMALALSLQKKFLQEGE